MADFDPNAFLAKVGEPVAPSSGGGFDPDGFLAKIEEPPAEPSLLDRAKTRVSSSFSNLAHTLKSGAGAAIEGLRHPIDTLTDPARRRELERGVGDVVTFGLANKLARAADPNNFGPDAERADAESAPGFRAAGNIGGMFLPSPASVAAARVAKAIPGTGAMANAARTTAAYEATAVPAAAIQAPSGHRLDAAVDAATDPAGLAVGAGGSLAGPLVAKVAGNAADRLAETPGVRARRIIEERGGGAKVGLTTPGKGGVFDRELAGIGNDDRAVGTAAERGAERLVEQIKEDHKVETSQPYRKLKEAIDSSPAGMKQRDVTPIVTGMQNAIDDLETPAPVRAAMKEQLALLEKHRADDGTVMLSERQLNGLRRELTRQAKIGRTDAPGAAEAPLRAVAFEAKKMVDDGPYAMLNEFYSKGARATEERRKLLGLKAKPASDEQVDVNKARLSLQRAEEMSNSNTAGAFADRVAKLREMNPDYRTAIDLPSLARARNDLTFSLAPAHGGLMARAGAGLAPLATGYGLLTHPVATLGGLAVANRAPIVGRVLHPLAETIAGGAAAGGASAAAVARLIQAARAGASRGQLEIQAQQDGTPPEIAANIAQQYGR